MITRAVMFGFFIISASIQSANAGRCRWARSYIFKFFPTQIGAFFKKISIKCSL